MSNAQSDLAQIQATDPAPAHWLEKRSLGFHLPAINRRSHSGAAGLQAPKPDLRASMLWAQRGVEGGGRRLHLTHGLWEAS